MTRSEIVFIMELYEFNVVEIDQDVELWVKNYLLVLIDYGKKKASMMLIEKDNPVLIKSRTLYETKSKLLKDILDYL